MRRSLRLAFFAALVAARAPTAQAAVISYPGYDVNDAVLSGHGNWAHTYSGAITPGVSFINGSFPGTTATYNGVGAGTLNDGIIGNSALDSQLFVTPVASDGTAINPSLFLTLSPAAVVARIDIYGGPGEDNTIPGAITSVTVGLLDTSFVLHFETFNTTPFGPIGTSGVPINDRIDLTGSTLDGIPAFTVILSNFQGTVENWFSITEIELNDEPVPEPSGLVLAALGLIGLAARGWRRGR